jgi:hypothetical protein
MLLQFHHVASDWWSFRIIHQTLTEFYNSKGKFSSPIDNLKEYNDIHCDEHVDAVVEKFWKTQLQAGIFRESIVGKKVHLQNISNLQYARTSPLRKGGKTKFYNLL